jgi:MHS family proline/betaine transporter-like MFS transporter
MGKDNEHEEKNGTSTITIDEESYPPPGSQRRNTRRVAIAAIVGNMIEYYDFSLYGLLAVVFAPLFFPSDNASTSVLAALVVIGAGYVSRPIGGVIFGHIGDRFGRKPVLVISLLLMGVASTVMGLLPTYASIGIAAPVILTITRMLQGISAGGETAGSQVFIVESAPEGRRGQFGALPAMAIGLGGALAFLIAGMISLVISPEDLSSWGWRIPFLLCFPLTLVCLWLRSSLEDTPEFENLESKDKVEKSPIRSVFRGHLGALVRVAILTLAALAPLHLAQTYMATHLVIKKGLPVSTVYILMALALILTLPLYPIVGKMGDKYGRSKIMAYGWALTITLIVPGFFLVDVFDNPFAIGSTVFVMMLPAGPIIGGVVYTAFTELFPANIRFSGMAIGFNLGTILAAGLGPYIAAQIVSSTGSSLSAGVWGMLCAGAGLLSLIGLQRSIDKAATDD